MTVVTLPTSSSNCYSAQSTDQQTGRLNNKSVKPISHSLSRVHTGGGVSLGTIMLIVGLCLWLCGTAPGTTLAGKILVGLAIAPTCCVIGLVICALTGKAVNNTVVT